MVVSDDDPWVELLEGSMTTRHLGHNDHTNEVNGE